jgi:hypothetical protein
MKKITVFLFGMLLLPPCLFSGETKISSVTGSADVKYLNKDFWYTARTGARLLSGQKIKTRPRSRVKVELSDGSRVEIYPNSLVDLKNIGAKAPNFFMMVGKLKAWVSHNVNRSKFEVNTPVAVCSVRGTEFTVDVDPRGQTDIEVDKGLVGVRMADGTGEEIPVGAGERLNVTAGGRLTPEQKLWGSREQSAVRNEVGLEMSKEAVQAAAAQEMRLAEYQEGKTMVDVFGSRVRLEEYIVRPAPDTFKLVLLNERESRFDYFYYKGTFNTTLPSDLSVALRDIGGKLGTTAPDYYLTAYERGYSNTQDYVKDNGTGGHLVKITYNSNGTFTLTDAADASNTRTVNAADAANGAYDPVADTFDASRTTALDVALYNPVSDVYENFSAGQTLWQTRFNSYAHVIDGINKLSYLPSNSARNILAGDLDGHWIYPSLDSAGNTIYGDWGVSSSASTRPEAGMLHNRIALTYRDNTSEQYDNYIISDEGKVASVASFNGITPGTPQYKAELLKWNYEQVITATEFKGRKIDLVIEPKILIKSGLLK